MHHIYMHIGVKSELYMPDRGLRMPPPGSHQTTHPSIQSKPHSDPDQKFELALDLKQLDTAKALLEEIRAAEAARDRGGSGEVSTETQTKWRKLGDLVRFEWTDGGWVDGLMDALGVCVPACLVYV